EHEPAGHALRSRRASSHPVSAARVAFLGTSAALTSATRDNTSLVFEASGVAILADCGGGAVHRLQRLGVDPLTLTHVVVTPPPRRSLVWIALAGPPADADGSARAARRRVSARACRASAHAPDDVPRVGATGRFSAPAGADRAGRRCGCLHHRTAPREHRAQ